VPLIAQVAALIAALLHVGFFLMESVLFGRPTVWARFGLKSAQEADVVRPMAFNQGFYNLFLAVGILAGLAMVAAANAEAGRAIVLFACACMVGAGVVLVATNRRFLAAGAMQALPPLVTIVATIVAGAS
jgi:putative membrane protein